MMSQVFANWTKLVVGLCAIIVTVGYVLGRVPNSDFNVIIGLVAGGLGITSFLRDSAKS